MKDDFNLVLDMLKLMTEEASGWMNQDSGISSNPEIRRARKLIRKYDPKWVSRREA
jgi:hypothetical protein